MHNERFFSPSDVCFLRLDFDTFTILGTGNTMESNGGECQDVFSVTVRPHLGVLQLGQLK